MANIEGNDSCKQWTSSSEIDPSKVKGTDTYKYCNPTRITFGHWTGTDASQSGPAITINSWCHYKDLCVLHGGFVAGTYWNPTNMSCFSIINLCRWICVQLSGMENTIPTFSFCVTKPHRFHFQTKNNISLKNLLDSSHLFFPVVMFKFL